jgi:vacuolar-type H+-ATPase subunit E/Vma4
VIKIGLEEIEAKIREGGEKEIEKIDTEAKEEIDQIKRDIQGRANAHADEVLKEGEREVEMVRRRIIADANTKVRELLSLERNRLIDRVFEEAKNRILGLDDKEKKRILENLVEGGRGGIKDPVILVDEKYKSLLNGAEPTKLNDFGVIIMSREGMVRIDNTIGSRLQQAKIKLKPKVASILFAENGANVSDR